MLGCESRCHNSGPQWAAGNLTEISSSMTANLQFPMGGGAVELSQGCSPHPLETDSYKGVMGRHRWRMHFGEERLRREEKKERKRQRQSEGSTSALHILHTYMNMFTYGDHSSTAAPQLLCIHDEENKYQHGAWDV